MNTSSSMSVRGIAAALLLLGAGAAHAALQDHGPVDPATGFPRWYRDLQGNALELCLGQTPSPNPLSGGAPMCFPWVASPVPPSFVGNFGEEAFYSTAGSALTGDAGFTARLDLALEAAYATGPAIRGDEMVFARVRVVMSVAVPGTYVVTHPYGVEVFPNVDAGKRAVFFTQDIGVAPGDFAGALKGRVGPFLQWDFLAPDETLEITLPDGTVESYLGDPNYGHTVTGSPFGTNVFRVDGPPGSGIGGPGVDFVETPLFTVVGKRYTKPIPSQLRVEAATYARDAAWTTIDVHVTGPAAAQLLVSGQNMPTSFMTSDGAGRWYAHAELPADVTPPGILTVSDLSTSPTTALGTGLVDVLTVDAAIYDPATRRIFVRAATSDHVAAPPQLDVLVPGMEATPLAADPASPWIASASAAIAAGAVPPATVTIVSSAGGLAVAPVVELATGAGAPAGPVAVDDPSVSAAQNVSASLAVLANDVLPSPAARVLVVSPPAHGTATWNAALAAVTYVPALNYNGADQFDYAVQDAIGRLSNVATVRITVARVNQAPVAVNDSVSTARDVAKTIAVLANDRDLDGALDPASVTIGAAPIRGTVTVNADGTITYRPAAGVTGSDSFTYTVRDLEGAQSNVATVSVLVSSPESLSLKTAQYVVSQGKWTIVGQSTVFGANLANVATAYVGSGTTGAVIGSATIDSTGKFQIVSAPGSVPGPDATRLVTVVSTGGGRITSGVALK